jgi:hypothetical protein
MLRPFHYASLQTRNETSDCGMFYKKCCFCVHRPSFPSIPSIACAVACSYGQSPIPALKRRFLCFKLEMFRAIASWPCKSRVERKIQASRRKTRDWTEKREIGCENPELLRKSMDWIEKSQEIFRMRRTAANWTKTHHLACTDSSLEPAKAVCR